MIDGKRNETEEKKIKNISVLYPTLSEHREMRTPYMKEAFHKETRRVRCNQRSIAAL